MFRMHSLFVIISLLALNLAACGSDLQRVSSEGPELRPLYQVAWNTDHQNISVLVHRSACENDAYDGANCQNGQINGHALVCPDRIIQLETGAEGFFPAAMQSPRSAALGEFDRLAYVLDRAGNLHVTDTGWSAVASDDLPLMLWSPGVDHVEILAGNARKRLAVVDLQGELKLWAVNRQDLYVLYQVRLGSNWGWGVEKISLVDYRVEEVRAEQTVEDLSDVPQELQITEEGHLKLYTDGHVLCDLPL
ncbi:hypothetical protein KKD52_15845 [Myxococcota bacterium]|nr:hypothetical protein [Myxococcota bacterium]MBU1410401.1 hypothetical protein [Myxococcota bacterium]MBU1511826.1 hypothetical protein [Myxococcota bacterium]PKN21945.1 MAG: hypothetical protein CVU65_15900 [Deltaproteobacteria bacterium HGW-Deltaproteobacteria-22]